MPLSILIKLQQKKTIDAFKRAGVYQIPMLWHYFISKKIPTAIEQYNQGIIDTDGFRGQLQACRGLIPINLTAMQFNAAWNAMCEVTDETVQAFNEIKKLEANGIKVYTLSTTSPLHANHITDQYAEKIPGEHFFSFQQGALSEALLAKLLEQIHKEHTDLDEKNRVLFYKDPGPHPYANWGILGKLLSPILAREHAKAVRYVNNLKRTASALGFTLVPYQPENGEPCITQQLPARWHFEMVASNAFTPLLNVKNRQPKENVIPSAGPVTNTVPVRNACGAT